MKAVVLALALLGCRSSPRSSEPVQDWGALRFTTVTAFQTNLGDSEFSRIRNTDGELTESRFPLEGILLNPSQIQRLRVAVTTTDHGGVAGCFTPRHAFLFHDADERIVGTLDVCFDCRVAMADPEGWATDYHWPRLRELVTELGLE